jgi:hypothetical protein
VKQLAQGHQRILGRNRSRAMDRAIAERVDDARLVEDGFTGRLLEARLVDQGRCCPDTEASTLRRA